MKKRAEQLLDAMGDVGLDLVELSELHEPFGGQWRRILPVAACLVLVTGITLAAAGGLSAPPQTPEACGPEETLITESAAEESLHDSLEEPEMSAEAPADDPVIPLYDLSVDYSDTVGNDYLCQYYVPQLNYDSPDALAINSEIAEIFGGQVEEQMRSMDAETSLWYTKIDANEYWYQDVVTLVCRFGTETEYVTYAAYHFDTQTQTRLTNRQLLERWGYDADLQLSALRQAAHRQFLQEVAVYVNQNPEAADPSVTELLWQQYHRTVEEPTLDLPLYVDADGVVHGILPIYYLAGGGYRHYDLTTSDPVSPWDSAMSGELDYRTLLTKLWDKGDPHMTLYLADSSNPSASGGYETVTLPRDWYLERFCVLMDSFTWTEQATPCPAPGSMWVNLSGDGFNWTFWEDNDAGFLVVQDPKEGIRFWKADYLYDTDRDTGSTIAQCIRHEYDGAVLDYESLLVEGSTATEVCENFSKAFGEVLTSQAPGSVYGATDFRTVSWELRAVGDPPADGRNGAILADFKVAVIPMLDQYKSWLWAGNSVEGEGEYEGWMIFSREVMLVQQADGLWKCEALGTGGLTLPE